MGDAVARADSPTYDATGGTIGAALAGAAAAVPDRKAVIFSDASYTFNDLAEGAARVESGLRAAGVRRGTKVAIWLPNCIEWIWTSFAVAALGGVVVPVNTRYRLEEVGYVLRQSDAQALVMADCIGPTDLHMILTELCPEVAMERGGSLKSSQFPRLRNIFSTGTKRTPGVRAFADLTSTGAPDEGLVDRASSQSIAHIQYTSGTTARPKGAMLSHCSVLRDATEICGAMGIGEHDRIFSALPFFHAAGFIAGLLAALTSRCTLVTSGHFEPLESLQLIEREQCTIIRGVDTMAIMMISHPDFSKYNVSSLRGGVIGSTSELVLRRVVDALGVRELTSVFGMSETASACTMTRVADPLEYRLGTQGRPLPGIEVKIVDPQSGSPRQQESAGEICIRGWNVMRGYYRKPAQTAKAIDREGWLHTGDLGLIDCNGNLRFLDRIKDVVRVGGENVSAAEVETLLVRHDGVQVAQVVAGPDQRLTEVCVAFVRLKTGASVSEEALIAYCQGKIASFKVPRRIFFVDEFPMTGSGKIQKFVLRERARVALSSVATAPQSEETP